MMIARDIKGVGEIFGKVTHFIKVIVTPIINSVVLTGVNTFMNLGMVIFSWFFTGNL